MQPSAHRSLAADDKLLFNISGDTYNGVPANVYPRTAELLSPNISSSTRVFLSSTMPFSDSGSI